jgi:Lrp/AsnC family leucine-responsive transcriptional regulator
MEQLDAFDLRILAALQEDGRLTNAALAERVHLSPSQVHRRTRQLEESGAIRRTVALLDPSRLGLGVIAFTNVSLERHSDVRATAFHDAIAAMPEVLACYSVTGEADYLLQVAATDLKAFSDFLMHRLMHLPGVRSVHSSVVLERVKETTALPLGHLEGDES